MVVEERLKRAIALRKDDVFLRSEFARFGSPAQLSRALRQLIAEGVLVKLGLGVFAKAKPSALTGNPIPAQPLVVLAPLVLQKLGVKVKTSRLVGDYNSGTSQQLAAGIVLDIGCRRITRKLGFGKQTVAYESHHA
ncbi:S-adenosylhomocysteine hydrolase [Pseudomonas sp. LRF_L74]|uniref:S-adenosylhomocysteine hydrolase n=1 Tax=Pseudomonas sp. LRF_L74 TaxID=3369422 RepID=UPI003F62319A